MLVLFIIMAYEALKDLPFNKSVFINVTKDIGKGTDRIFDVSDCKFFRDENGEIDGVEITWQEKDGDEDEYKLFLLRDEFDILEYSVEFHKFSFKDVKALIDEFENAFQRICKMRNISTLDVLDYVQFSEGYSDEQLALVDISVHMGGKIKQFLEKYKEVSLEELIDLLACMAKDDDGLIFQQIFADEKYIYGELLDKDETFENFLIERVFIYEAPPLLESDMCAIKA